MNKHFEINEEGRDFVVGDLHGCKALFLNSLKDINFNGEIDRVFSVGDLVDRGADSMGCLELLYKPWFHSVLGNHDRFFIEGIMYGRNLNLWDQNGGIWRHNFDPDDLFILADLAKRTMPMSITVDTPRGRVGICHAQPPTNNWNDTINPSDEQIETMLWSRNKIRNDCDKTKNIYMTYHGHTVSETTQHRGNAVFIDTGAVFTGNLTMRRINYK